MHFFGKSSLKIASNNVFGYYIEVRNAHKDKVPDEWIRKQTLVNAERYITEELKEYESKILGAEERILAIEQQLFSELVLFISKYIKPVQENAMLIAQIDCLGNAMIRHPIERDACLHDPLNCFRQISALRI